MGNGAVGKVFKKWKIENGISKWAGIQAMAVPWQRAWRWKLWKTGSLVLGTMCPIGKMDVHEWEGMQVPPATVWDELMRPHPPTPDAGL